MTNQDLSPASLPSLSPVLSLHYQSLPIELKQLFSKVFRYCWHIANSRRYFNRGGVLLNYWCVDMLRRKQGLTTSQLALLSYIYTITNKGTTVIHSNQVYQSKVLPDVKRISVLQLLYKLNDLGYLSRSTSDPSRSSFSSGYARQPVFISLTRAGVQVIEGIEKDLYKLLLNTSLDDLTGKHKKTG
jgi:hypothetical protein